MYPINEHQDFGNNIIFEDGVLYNHDKTRLIQYLETNRRSSFIVPDSVTEIGAQAFRNCKHLCSIVIPDSVLSLEWYTFFGCDNLDSVSVSEDANYFDWIYGFK